MAYKFIEARLGLPPVTAICSVGTTTNLPGGGNVVTNVQGQQTPFPPVGTIVRAEDPTLGQGEFIFLPGVASTVVGSLVTYNSNGSSSTTTLAPNTANLGQPVAVAMAANTSTTALSWYQIDGIATVKKSAVKINPAVSVWISSTAGRVQGTTASGKQILGAKTVNAATVASATSTVLVVLNRPHAQGQVV